MRPAVHHFILLLLLTAALPAQTADLIVHGAVLETVDARYPDATAIAVKGDRILAVGSDARILALEGENTKVIDAKGAFCMPGFIEGHGHFAGLGASLRNVNLAGVTSYDEVIRRVRSFIADKPKGTWITGRGWDQNLWKSKAFPTHEALSRAIPEHPVMLTRVDGHAALANAAALAAAGIDDSTPNMTGGEIIRDADGHATGVLIDRAMSLVRRVMPRDDDLEVIRGDLVRAQELCFSEGITTFHDAGSSPTLIGVMDEMMGKDRLHIRLYVMIAGGSSRLVKRMAGQPPLVGKHAHRLTARAFKLSIDGALGSRGAAMLEDYEDRSGHRGLLMFDHDEMVKIADAATGGGYQICVHAIGDRANRTVLDAIEEATKKHPRLADLRPRIEHAQILDENDIPRFAKLGVVASMQGVHCTSDGPWVPTRIGEARTAEGAYVWRKLLDAGVVLNNGTDAPVENVSALASFHSTVTRQTRAGPFHLDQKLTRREAIYSYTMAGAWAAFEENLKGSLTPGKLADFILIDRNLLTCEDDAILEAKVLRTVCGGRVVF